MKPVVIDSNLPDYAFRWDINIHEWLAWANDPANQTPANLAKAGAFHPIIRNRWLELGLIVLAADADNDAAARNAGG